MVSVCIKEYYENKNWISFKSANNTLIYVVFIYKAFALHKLSVHQSKTVTSLCHSYFMRLSLYSHQLPSCPIHSTHVSLYTIYFAIP